MPGSPGRPDPLPRHGGGRRLRIGLLGGSFNPAHAGHAHIARAALRALRLDQVWLLVSPGNPLKPGNGMAPLEQRLASARRIGSGRRIIATAIEAALGTRYTADTIAALKRRFPRCRFVWLMGADNLSQLPRWNRWQEIVRAIPIAVLPRPGETRRALAGQAARMLHAARRPAIAAAALADAAPPAWTWLPIRENSISATALRRARACAFEGESP
ncbi:MAG TPA: nicotinate-nucleotide adenylyltransferase [Acetobacteraceae bacterium]|nr:nicotinate-nucleotide adenylyltransferase [Acetobacteraceae bacterium]